MDWLGDFLGLNKGKATQEAALNNSTALTNLRTEGLGYLQDGYTGAKDNLTQSGEVWSPLSGGLDLYADSLGINGVDGNQRATDAFQAGPGYEFQMDQGLKALDRRASAAGNFQSGGANLDTLTYAQGLANQSFGDWRDSLGGASMAGANAQSGNFANLADLELNNAAAKTGFAGDVTSAQTGASNMLASGKEAGQGGLWDIAGNVAGIAGAAFGLNKNGGRNDFAGYGG